MLNVNAKAFVPQSIVDHMSAHTNTIYRYLLVLPMNRECHVSESSSETCDIMTLLARRLLCSSSQGGLGEEPLQLFITGFFDSVENVSSDKKPNASTGILLSRSILSLSAPISSIVAVNDAPGYLIHVDLPRGYGADIALQLRAAWFDFFEPLRGDLRITSLGYVSSTCGTSSTKRYEGAYRHYFFLSCAHSDAQMELLSLKHLMDLHFPIFRVVPVNAVVSFLCSPRTPISVVISVGEAAKEKLLSNGKPHRTLSISFYPFGASQTFLSFKEYEESLLSFLKGNERKWCSTYILHVNIEFCRSTSTNVPPIPVWDLVQFIGYLCDDTATSLLGICVSDDTLNEGIQVVTSDGEGNGCYLNATLKSVLEKGRSLDTSSFSSGLVPHHIKRPFTPAQYEYVRNQVEKWLPAYNKSVVLTRMTFASAADHFAKCKYYVRNRTLGENILLIADAQGDLFGVDMNTASIFALPNCFDGAIAPMRNSIFTAVVTSSFRGYLECVIVIDDVLCFEGTNVCEISFPERWLHVEKTVLDDQASRPHANADYVAIVRCAYLSFERTEDTLRNPPLEHPTLGLVFVPHLPQTQSGKFSVYSWIPPETITARFVAGNVEGIPETNGEGKRAWLYVKDKNGRLVPYNREYVDYLLDAFPLIKNGSVFECMLRRSDDGAHWWELLKDYDSCDRKTAHSYEFLDNIVHTPGLTHEEMLWLLKASTFKCGRCQTVSDIGRSNPRYQAYWCQNCWAETGHGECVYCGRSCTMGKVDSVSKRFYCDNCWNVFSTTNTEAELGYLVPPPPNSSFSTQVLTRCVSLLIDAMNPKAPTNDVLDICCGGGVARKWIKNKTTRYVGFDLKSTVVEATNELISSLSSEMPDVSSYDVICADAFSTDLWTQHITRIHPRQFHAITGFAGLHHAFRTESKARHVVGSISNALVPGGVFFGCFLDASTLYSRGKNSNDLFMVDWDEDFVPRIGHQFLFSIQDGPKKKINVIAIDFFVAVAREYGLCVIPEICLTFREFLENDPNFTKVPSKSEKEYLCAMRTFAFRKDGSPQLRPLCKGNGINGE